MRATDGKIEGLVVVGGSGYTDGTYYVAVYGDGTMVGTSSGAIVSIKVSGGAIQGFGLSSGTDTILHSGGVDIHLELLIWVLIIFSQMRF